uniref:Uncharacterized protein n=1 Tax=Timema tahoe TaxID=61484 RepID=A0A7R9IQR2_9NEOP|nr:unnamed protein product [Timema tahoe]
MDADASLYTYLDPRMKATRRRYFLVQPWFGARFGGLSRSRTPVVIEICLTGVCGVHTSRDVLVVDFVFPVKRQDSLSQLLPSASSIRIELTSLLGTSVAGSPWLVHPNLRTRTRGVYSSLEGCFSQYIQRGWLKGRVNRVVTRGTNQSYT